MMKFLFNLISILSFLLLSSCGSITPTQKKTLADNIALEGHFINKMVKGDKFWLYTYQKISDPSKPFVVYIEGDGAVVSGGTISTDPTPKNPMLIKLASMDSRPNILYVARPCQYAMAENKNVCNSDYWTGKRMSIDSINAINDVIKNVTKNKPLDLIGFSGGGGIAILVAERNSNVKTILTIAGNLDHVAFNKYHHTDQMLESLNPIDYAKKINNIPQLHLSGEEDRAVPPFIAELYVRASNSKCVKNKIFPSFTHSKGWDSVWQEIISKPITCDSDL